jgi:2-polyprenyl-3-methyl-5-hydroxy-6-metoxy-1,4-benzoquinol methylase
MNSFLYENLMGYYDGSRLEIQACLPSEYNTVLEVGCGIGNFSNSLKNNIELWGVEPHPDAFKIASTKQFKTLLGVYDEIEDQLPDSYFDLVICNDVIEHMPDHKGFLKSIQCKMKPTASLIGSMPNVRFYKNLYAFLIKKDWKYANSGILDYTHLCFFTEKSLKETLIDSGFKIHFFKGINPKGAHFKTLIGIFKYFFFFFFPDTKFTQFGFRVGLK